MLHQKPIVSIVAVFALLMGNAAGWVHILIHADGQCECSPSLVSYADDHQPSELHSTSHCDLSCGQSPLRARSIAKRAAAERAATGSTECCESESVVNPREPAPEPHDSDECAICQHFLTSRNQAVVVMDPVGVSLGAPTAYLSVVRQVIRPQFRDSIYFLRGPPVA